MLIHYYLLSLDGLVMVADAFNISKRTTGTTEVLATQLHDSIRSFIVVFYFKHKMAALSPEFISKGILFVV